MYCINVRWDDGQPDLQSQSTSIWMPLRNHLSHRLDLLSQNPDLNSRGHHFKWSRTVTISNSFSSKLFGSEGLCVMDEERDPPAYHSHILLLPFGCLVYSSGGIVTGLNCSSDCNNRLLYHSSASLLFWCSLQLRMYVHPPLWHLEGCYSRRLCI